MSMASTSGVNISTGLDNQRNIPVEVEAQDRNSSISIPNPCKRKQLAITNYVPKKMSVDTQKKLDHSLLKLFTKDLQPFSVVDDPGFKEFVHLLNPTYKIPNRHSISKVLIPAEYEKCMNAMKLLIDNELETGCITTDCWTSRNTEGFMAITIHFIDLNFVLRSVLLSCHPYSESHTSENLSKEIKNVLKVWGVDKKIVFAVSDNAYNIKNALSTLQLKNLGCFAHTLNLIVQSALKQESSLIDKVKAISTHFRKSTTAHHKLMTYQTNLGEKQPKKMLQDVSTRWNSTFYMLQRFVDLELAIRGTIGLLDKAPDSLNSEEWLTIKEFCKVLSPFEEATRAISGEQYMTASLTIVIVQGLQNVCELMKKCNYSQRTNGLINNLVTGMNDRQSWGNIEKSNTLGKCTFLDPRFKNVPYVSNDSMLNTIKNDIIDSTSQLISLTRSEVTTTSNIELSTSLGSTSQPKEKTFSIWETIDTQVTHMQPVERTSKSRAIIEVQRYMEEALVPRNSNPLIWWKEQKHNFPFLSILARRMLCCLSSSVPCERVFSKAGLVLSDRRCRLNSKKAQMLLFLNQNGNY